MDFNELLTIASSGNTSMKLGILESWVKSYSAVLEKLIELKRLEIDLAKPSCSNLVPAWLAIKHGELQLTITTLENIANDLRKYDEREAARLADHKK